MGAIRLFYAFWPTALETRALAEACRALFPISGRPVEPRDQHVTLAFVGGVAAARLDAFLELAGPTEPVTLEFDVLEHWAKPRVLVTTTRTVPDALRSAVDRLWQRLDRLGIARDPRPLRPHVTLARDVRRWHREGIWTPVVWRADRIRLVASRPGVTPRYQPLDGPAG